MQLVAVISTASYNAAYARSSTKPSYLVVLLEYRVMISTVIS
jgi:hypothetical protein